jgi:hypothetical protein
MRPAGRLIKTSLCPGSSAVNESTIRYCLPGLDDPPPYEDQGDVLGSRSVSYSCHQPLPCRMRRAASSANSSQCLSARYLSTAASPRLSPVIAERGRHFYDGRWVAFAPVPTCPDVIVW